MAEDIKNLNLINEEIESLNNKEIKKKDTETKFLGKKTKIIKSKEKIDKLEPLLKENAKKLEKLEESHINLANFSQLIMEGMDDLIKRFFPDEYKKILKDNESILNEIRENNNLSKIQERVNKNNNYNLLAPLKNNKKNIINFSENLENSRINLINYLNNKKIINFKPLNFVINYNKIINKSDNNNYNNNYLNTINNTLEDYSQHINEYVNQIFMNKEEEIKINVEKLINEQYLLFMNKFENNFNLKKEELINNINNYSIEKVLTSNEFIQIDNIVKEINKKYENIINNYNEIDNKIIGINQNIEEVKNIQQTNYNNITNNYVTNNILQSKEQNIYQNQTNKFEEIMENNNNWQKKLTEYYNQEIYTLKNEMNINNINQQILNINTNMSNLKNELLFYINQVKSDLNEKVIFNVTNLTNAINNSKFDTANLNFIRDNTFNLNKCKEIIDNQINSFKEINNIKLKELEDKLNLSNTEKQTNIEKNKNNINKLEEKINNSNNIIENIKQKNKIEIEKLTEEIKSINKDENFNLKIFKNNNYIEEMNKINNKLGKFENKLKELDNKFNIKEDKLENLRNELTLIQFEKKSINTKIDNADIEILKTKVEIWKNELDQFKLTINKDINQQDKNIENLKEELKNWSNKINIMDSFSERINKSMTIPEIRNEVKGGDITIKLNSELPKMKKFKKKIVKLDDSDDAEEEELVDEKNYRKITNDLLDLQNKINKNIVNIEVNKMENENKSKKIEYSVEIIKEKNNELQNKIENMMISQQLLDEKILNINTIIQRMTYKGNKLSLSNKKKNPKTSDSETNSDNENKKLNNENNVDEKSEDKFSKIKKKLFNNNKENNIFEIDTNMNSNINIKEKDYNLREIKEVCNRNNCNYCKDIEDTVNLLRNNIENINENLANVLDVDDKNMILKEINEQINNIAFYIKNNQENIEILNEKYMKIQNDLKEKIENYNFNNINKTQNNFDLDEIQNRDKFKTEQINNLKDWVKKEIEDKIQLKSKLEPILINKTYDNYVKNQYELNNNLKKDFRYSNLEKIQNNINEIKNNLINDKELSNKIKNNFKINDGVKQRLISFCFANNKLKFDYETKMYKKLIYNYTQEMIEINHQSYDENYENLIFISDMENMNINISNNNIIMNKICGFCLSNNHDGIICPNIINIINNIVNIHWQNNDKTKKILCSLCGYCHSCEVNRIDYLFKCEYIKRILALSYLNSYDNVKNIVNIELYNNNIKFFCNHFNWVYASVLKIINNKIKSYNIWIQDKNKLFQAKKYIKNLILGKNPVLGKNIQKEYKSIMVNRFGFRYDNLNKKFSKNNVYFKYQNNKNQWIIQRIPDKVLLDAYWNIINNIVAEKIDTKIQNNLKIEIEFDIKNNTILRLYNKYIIDNKCEFSKIGEKIEYYKKLIQELKNYDERKLNYRNKRILQNRLNEYNNKLNCLLNYPKKKDKIKYPNPIIINKNNEYEIISVIETNLSDNEDPNINIMNEEMENKNIKNDRFNNNLGLKILKIDNVPNLDKKNLESNNLFNLDNKDLKIKEINLKKNNSIKSKKEPRKDIKFNIGKENLKKTIELKKNLKENNINEINNESITEEEEINNQSLNLNNIHFKNLFDN